MERVKLKNFRVVFGDGAYLSRVFELLGEDAACYAPILAGKRVHELKDYLGNLRLKPELKELITKLPTLFGGKEELAELGKLSAFDPVLKKRCGYIGQLFMRLAELGLNGDGMVFDPGEMRGLDYYTGVGFEVLHTETGALLGGGGRYDSLMRKFQLEYTACGMALYLSEIESLAETDAAGPQADWIVIGSENLAKAEELRGKGLTVVHLFDRDELENFTASIKAKNIFGNR